jgi:acetyl esterase
MTLDSATAAFVAEMAAAGSQPLSAMSPDEARAQMVQLSSLYGPGPEMARVEDLKIPGEDGEVAVRVLVPTGEVRAVIVYVHGGGWVLGSVDEWDALTRSVAAQSHCAVVVPEYRRAPEHPFPAPLEDCWSALLWADRNVAAIAGDAVPVIVAGDSAGGNIAAAMAIRARERGGPDLALQVLVYPVADANFETPSYLDEGNQLLLDRDSMLWFWDQYVAGGEDRANPEVSPLRVADPAGLPPAVVLVAEHDVLRSEVEALRDHLEAGGVEVRSRLFEGQMHGFICMVDLLPGSAPAIEYVCEEIDNCLTTAAA